jgi:excinuclease ABC subunit A
MWMKKISLIPIGEIIKTDSVSFIKLYSRYCKGLKNLEFFSHLIVFTDCEDGILYHIKKIIKTDRKEGLIIVEQINIPDNTVVFDIKPYMPCEDRIKGDVYKKESSITFDETKEYKTDTDVLSGNVDIIEKSLKGKYRFNSKQELLLESDFDIARLKDAEYLRVFWWFDRFDRKDLRRILEVNPPYENAPVSGVFATRSPVRPNLIASTTVKVSDIDINKGIIYIKGFDGYINSGIIDVFPYNMENENIENVYVPDYLEHWPKFKNFIDNKKNISDSNLPVSDIGILRNMQDNSRNSEVKKHIAVNTGKTREGYISIIKANENNLKNISLDIPKNKITVISGVSGSGKSSLAFDTLFKESQHQFMDIMGTDNNVYLKPDVEQITGLMPAVSIEQKSISNNPRSTVGTVTGLSNQLRLLYSLIGLRHCPICHDVVEALKEDEIINLIQNLVKSRNIKIYPFGKEHLIKENINDAQTIRNLLDEGNGAIFVLVDGLEPLRLQTREYCYTCDRIFFDMTPSMFSFNNQDYMCPSCKGMGVMMKPSEDLIVHNKEVSILDNASRIWGDLRKFQKNPNANWMKGQVLALARDMNVDLDIPYKELPKEYRRQIMHGSDGREVSIEYEQRGRKGVIKRPVEGAINIVNRLLSNTSSSNIGLAEGFLEKTTCSHCNGERLSDESRLVTIDSIRYPEAAKMNIQKLKNWIQKLEKTLPAYKKEIVSIVLVKMDKQLDKIIDVGLSYLAPQRSVTTLSGGEGQRLKLASQFNNTLSNILYILDEPTMGLHPRDYGFLMDKLKELRDNKNTVVIVEHKMDIIKAADFLVDIGPGAGRYGGEIIAMGTPDEVIADENSVTGKYMSEDNIDILKESIYDKKVSGEIKLFGAVHNNLKNLDVSFPLNSFICMTGVSGSGKSSLVSDTLAPAIARYLGKNTELTGKYQRIEVPENVKDIIHVTQAPIGRTPRSNPATFTGVFDLIRDLYSGTDSAKEKKFKKEHFSFNSKKGQCAVCGGAGKIQHKSGFMPDIWIRCKSCNGTRYKEEILEIKYKGFNVSEILDMEVSEAVTVFENDKKIQSMLKVLIDIGLGYIKLGQSALTLSGGEAQRIKLAKELCRSDSYNLVYILDEPTTGMHSKDIARLIKIIKKLSVNNTVISIEHNAEFIKHADYIIEMGPAGGENGGHIIAKGTPYELT